MKHRHIPFLSEHGENARGMLASCGGTFLCFWRAEIIRSSRTGLTMNKMRVIPEHRSCSCCPAPVDFSLSHCRSMMIKCATQPRAFRDTLSRCATQRGCDAFHVFAMGARDVEEYRRQDLARLRIARCGCVNGIAQTSVWRLSRSIRTLISNHFVSYGKRCGRREMCSIDRVAGRDASSVPLVILSTRRGGRRVNGYSEIGSKLVIENNSIRKM